MQGCLIDSAKHFHFDYCTHPIILKKCNSWCKYQFSVSLYVDIWHPWNTKQFHQHTAKLCLNALPEPKTALQEHKMHWKPSQQTPQSIMLFQKVTSSVCLEWGLLGAVLAQVHLVNFIMHSQRVKKKVLLGGCHCMPSLSLSSQNIPVLISHHSSIVENYDWLWVTLDLLVYCLAPV